MKDKIKMFICMTLFILLAIIGIITDWWVYGWMSLFALGVGYYVRGALEEQSSGETK